MSDSNRSTFKRSSNLYFRAVVVVFCVWSMVLHGSSAMAYRDRAQRHVAMAALDLLRGSPELALRYAEVCSGSFSNMLVSGAGGEAQDLLPGADHGVIAGSDRYTRHFRGVGPDQSVGLAWNACHRWLWVLDGSFALSPGSTHFPGAAAWAQDGAGSWRHPDLNLLNLRGAVEAYGYTDSSRAQAYYRLGHVMHVITDMAQPDHARGLFHPCSMMEIPEQLGVILSFMRMAGISVVDQAWFSAAVPGLRQSQSQIGYEAFVERILDPIRSSRPSVVGSAPDRRKNLKAHLDAMVVTAMGAVEDGPEPFGMPLGCDIWPRDTENRKRMLQFLEDSHAAGTLGPVAQYCLFPVIKIGDPAECAEYEVLALSLLRRASELNAGLLQYFADNARPPPYVRTVVIRDESGRTRYAAEWEDIHTSVSGQHCRAGTEGGPRYEYVCVSGRRFRTVVSRPLRTGATHSIRVCFGAPGLTTRENMAGGRIDVHLGPQAIDGAWNAVSLDWTGEFTVEASAAETELRRELRIEAALPDYSAGSISLTLDSDPSVPARRMGHVPFPWEGYRPGADQCHTVRLASASGSASNLAVVVKDGARTLQEDAVADQLQSRVRVCRDGVRACYSRISRIEREVKRQKRERSRIDSLFADILRSRSEIDQMAVQMSWLVYGAEIVTRRRQSSARDVGRADLRVDLILFHYNVSDADRDMRGLIRASRSNLRGVKRSMDGVLVAKRDLIAARMLYRARNEEHLLLVAGLNDLGKELASISTAAAGMGRTGDSPDGDVGQLGKMSEQLLAMRQALRDARNKDNLLGSHLGTAPGSVVSKAMQDADEAEYMASLAEGYGFRAEQHALSFDICEDEELNGMAR